MNSILEYGRRNLYGNYSFNNKQDDCYLKMCKLMKAFERDNKTKKQYRYIRMIPNYASRLGIWNEYWNECNGNEELFYAWCKYKLGLTKLKNWEDVKNKVKELIPDII